MKWFHYVYTYIPTFLSRPPTPSPVHSRLKASAVLPCSIQQALSCLFLSWQCIYVSPTPSSSPSMSTGTLSMSVSLSCPANRFICTIFSRSHIGINIWHCFLSLSDFLRPVWQDCDSIHITTNDATAFGSWLNILPCVYALRSLHLFICQRGVQLPSLSLTKEARINNEEYMTGLLFFNVFCLLNDNWFREFAAFCQILTMNQP